MAAEWTADDIESLNPKDADQQGSFLHHLYKTGAATPPTLCAGSDLLEQQAGPFVLAYGQLPFELEVPSATFRVPGWRNGVVVELRFSRATTRVDHLGALVRDDAADDVDGAPLVGRFTQVTGLVRLWTRRAQLHAAYVSCLTPTGLRNEVIGRVGDWMDAPEAKMALPARRYAPLTAQAFQAEVARRVRTEFLRAIHLFVQAYGVANLESTPSINTLFGYFLLIAPGRVACASTPVPIMAGLAAGHRPSFLAGPSAEAIRSMIGRPFREDDRVLRQLMAMHRLLNDEEPELALVGSVMAVEWFLNERLADGLRPKLKQKTGSFSIRRMAAAGALDFLPSASLERLVSIAELRNSFVHGAPPNRPSALKRRLNGGSTDSIRERARDSIFLALEVYRQTNIAFETPSNVVASGVEASIAANA